MDEYIKKEAAITALLNDAQEQVGYSKGKLDKRLQSIMGLDYPEHDVRYTVNIGKPMYDGGIVIGTVRGGRN